MKHMQIACAIIPMLIVSGYHEVGHVGLTSSNVSVVPFVTLPYFEFISPAVHLSDIMKTYIVLNILLYQVLCFLVNSASVPTSKAAACDPSKAPVNTFPGSFQLRSLDLSTSKTYIVANYPQSPSTTQDLSKYLPVLHLIKRPSSLSATIACMVIRRVAR